MNIKERLDVVLEAMPEERLRQVLEFAEFLHGRDERSAWQEFGREQLARAYGPDEPEYTRADVKRPR